MRSQSNGSDDGAEQLVDEECPEEESKPTTFKALGVCDEVCEACDGLKWSAPTQIQAESIPHLVKGTACECSRNI